MGQCPVYSARIYLDGTVAYKGEYFVKTLGESRYVISDKKVNELLDTFAKADYFSLESHYRSDVSCQPSTITTFNLNGRRKRIVNECTGPANLERLENTIERIAGLKELIGKRDSWFI